MVQTLLYDRSFGSFLCAVFDAYEYRYGNADICTEKRFKGNLFEQVHRVHTDEQHSDRVWKGLQARLSKEACESLYRAFLSEEEGIENTLLAYVRYVFASTQSIETDYSHPAVLHITQTAKKVSCEKHRMEAFVRFQKTADGLFYALIEPSCNVLPLVAPHFEKRYADQRWLIYDGIRRYGIHYDGVRVTEVEIAFREGTVNGKNAGSVYDESEAFYQVLWQQYFKSVNIAARRNTRLHLQHMPRRYWKHLTEKKPGY
jgi:probable DNA metabolism protein